METSNLYGTGTGMHLRAHDAKLISNNVDDLQSALDRLSVWLHSCQLRLATTKHERLHISHVNKSLESNFPICSHIINTVTCVKHLGICNPSILTGLNQACTTYDPWKKCGLVSLLLRPLIW